MSSSGDIFQSFTDEYVIWALSFNGGLYDAVGYYQLQGLFTSSITGNMIAASYQAYSPVTNISKTCTTISFFLAAGLGTIISVNFKKRLSWNTRHCSIFLFAIYLLLLIVVWILGVQYASKIEEARLEGKYDDPCVVLMGSLMVQ